VLKEDIFINPGKLGQFLAIFRRAGLDGREHFFGNFFKKRGVFSPFSKQKWTGDQKSHPSFYTNKDFCISLWPAHVYATYYSLRTLLSRNFKFENVFTFSDSAFLSAGSSTELNIEQPPAGKEERSSPLSDLGSETRNRKRQSSDSSQNSDPNPASPDSSGSVNLAFNQLNVSLQDSEKETQPAKVWFYFFMPVVWRMGYLQISTYEIWPAKWLFQTTSFISL